MKQVLTKLDKIIIICRNIQQSTALYSQALGLKVYLQSDTFVQLRDTSNFSIYLKQSLTTPSHLIKGYSPMLSFRVDDFQRTCQKLKKYDLLIDGKVQQSQFGRVMTFVGMEGEMITINDFGVMEEEERLQQNNNGGNDGVQKQGDSSKQSEEIKRLLRKIKI